MNKEDALAIVADLNDTEKDCIAFLVIIGDYGQRFGNISEYLELSEYETKNCLKSLMAEQILEIGIFREKTDPKSVGHKTEDYDWSIALEDKLDSEMLTRYRLIIDFREAIGDDIYDDDEEE